MSSHITRMSTWCEKWQEKLSGSLLLMFSCLIACHTHTGVHHWHCGEKKISSHIRLNQSLAWIHFIINENYLEKSYITYTSNCAKVTFLTNLPQKAILPHIHVKTTILFLLFVLFEFSLWKILCSCFIVCYSFMPNVKSWQKSQQDIPNCEKKNYSSIS